VQAIIQEHRANEGQFRIGTITSSGRFSRQARASSSGDYRHRQGANLRTIRRDPDAIRKAGHLVGSSCATSGCKAACRPRANAADARLLRATVESTTGAVSAGKGSSTLLEMGIAHDCTAPENNRVRDERLGQTHRTLHEDRSAYPSSEASTESPQDQASLIALRYDSLACIGH